MDPTRLHLAAARARLAAMKGKTYWRSLDELADTEEFQTFLHREFPEEASEWFDSVSRRSFLRMMGASLALAGLGACTRQPEEKIVPYAANPPEEFIPGQPLQYATAMPFGGYGLGVLVESHMGRPTKIEGNERHPASLGATDIFAQASILSLYDPDRSQVVTHNSRPNTWEAFVADLTNELNGQKNKRGAGLRILTETVTSPTLAAQIERVLAAFPEARWHQYDPIGRDNEREGARLAFGEYVDVHYDLSKADVILSLDADFLGWGPGKVRYARDFAARRKVRGGKGEMNRLYVVESTPSITGSVADHRWSMSPAELNSFLSSQLRTSSWYKAVAEDLLLHLGRSIVMAGETQSPEVHALVHTANSENIGETVFYTEPVEARPENHAASLRTLVADMLAGKVEVLLILGGNPVFNAPVDLDFRAALTKTKWRAHLGMYDDETSEWCHWHVPQAHFLEAWGDIRAYEGTVSLQQPLIAPLYDGRSALELLAVVRENGPRKGHDILREYWKAHGLEDEKLWQVALHDGVVPGTAAKAKKVAAKPRTESITSTSTTTSTMELVLRPDPCVWDGEWANNGWLQELPKPLTKITWDNTALIAPATAEKLGLQNGDMVKLKTDTGEVTAPAWILPGQAANVVALHLGYGRTRAGRVGTGAGVNAYALRTSDQPWSAGPVTFTKTGKRVELAVTQHHHLMEGRQLVRSGTLGEYREHPDVVHDHVHEPPAGSLFPRWKYDGHSWGMSIDLGSCIGCNACVVACQSENNIPVVGKAQVIRGREMHWLRIDHYYEGDPDNPESHHQPVPCMHCENAPCEVVCPVAATTHSAEGLNEMTYNRCVGTRYCANNCPYKVRRFNFLQFSDNHTPSLKMLANPDVTVRMRGVMEKCTYCVQRINSVRITSKKDDRPIRDGEITPACAQACPAEAIVFGDINDPQSRVSQLKADKLNYGLLEELNTLPRTTYLAKLKNPNPALMEKADS